MSKILRTMLTAAGLWLLAASLGAATDMYDELSSGEINLMYPEPNYIDPELPGSLAEAKADSVLRTLLLYRMLSSYRNQDASPNVLAGPNWIPSDAILVPPETDDLSLVKDNIMKRTVKRVAPTAKAPVKTPVPKLKKKVKGASVICYFKLCAFRPPN